MIKRLAKCIREYTFSTIMAPVTMIGEVAMEVLIPTVMAVLIDKGINAGDMRVVVRQCLLLALCAVCSMLFGVGSAVFASHAGTGFARNLRHDMFHNVQTFDFANIDKLSTSSIVTRLTTDVAHLQMSFQMLIRMAVRCPMMLILAMVMAFRIEPKLCVVYCVVLPLLAFGLLYVAKFVHVIFVRAF